MSITSNAQFKIVENIPELLAVLAAVDIDTSGLETEIPKAKILSDSAKHSRKKWQLNNPDKLKAYQQKYYASDKGKAMKLRKAEKERTPEKRAVRKAYFDRPEIKDRRKKYFREYYIQNKDQIRSQHREYYTQNKERIFALHREYCIQNKDQILAKERERYARNIEKERARGREKYARKKAERLAMQNNETD